MSPADRIRLLRVLETHGSDYIGRLQELKYLLAPLIARNEAEQELFYTIFNNYIEEAGKPEPGVVEPVQPAVVPLLSRYVWWILGALGLLLLGLLLYVVVSKPPPPAWGIIAPPRTHLDSVIYIRNAAGDLDTNTFTYHWLIRDEGSNNVELRDSQKLEWRPRINSLIDSPQKVIDFWVIDRSDNKEVHRSSSRLAIVCTAEERPVIQKIDLPEEIRPGKDIIFQAIVSEREHLAYEWRMRDTILSTEETLNHRFEEVGKYRIQLIVRDTAAATICENDKVMEVNVQEEEEPLALLSMMPLKKDTLQPVNRFRSWVWWFLMLPLGLCVYAWWRWWYYRQQLEREREQAQEAKIAAAVARDQKKKQPPFLIPFSDQNPYIQRDAASQRLADALRQRQEGRRKRLDVTLSLEATVAQGGFPSPRYRFDQQATEYLFLVDRQAPDSHQFELFHFLVNELHRQEAYIDTYYYDTEFYRFWNSHHPDGVSMDVLQRQYPGHRLVVLGDAHALLDPGGRGLPDIKANYKAALNTWKQRLLITPVPPLSWTFRERVLDNQFAVFPADIAGLEAAAHFIESDLNPEDLPASFPEWQRQLTHKREEADINYRDWTDIDELEDHFADRPDLMTWLRALAVYPKPNWAVTVLIGRALADKGVAVSYDNLLQLARVEWLQTGSWDETLRQDLMAGAEADSLQLARRAVRNELEEIQKTVIPNSFAAAALDTQLAVLDFELDPDADKNKEALFLLLSQNQLSARQVAELEQHLQQHLATQGGKSNEVSIRDFVAPVVMENEAEEGDADTVFTQPFWLAMGATTLLFLTALLLLATNPEHLSKNSILVKAEIELDSVVLLNNMGVDAFYGRDLSLLDTLVAQGPEAVINYDGNVLSAVALFSRSLQKDPEYALASRNTQKANYNTLTYFYNHILKEDSWARDSLFWLEESFDRYTDVDSFRLDAWHAMGLISYYLDQEQSPYANQVSPPDMYYDLLSATNYFDTLSLYPNLETFLNLRPRIRSVETNYQDDDALDLTIEYTSNAADVPLELRAMIVDQEHALVQGTTFMNKAISENGARTDIITLPAVKTRRGSAGDSILVWIYNLEEKLPTVEYVLPFVPPQGRRQPTVPQRIPSLELAPNQIYCITNMTRTGIAVRNRLLSRDELALMNDKAETAEAQRLSNQTAIGALQNDDPIIFVREHALQYEIQFEGRSGFITKTFRGQPTLRECPEGRQEIISNTVIVNGRVQDQANGAPLSGVQVSLVRRNDVRQAESGPLQGTTDDQGSFSISGISSAVDYELRLEKEGFGMVGGRAEVRSGRQWAEQTVQKSMLQLNRNFEVRGTLIDAVTRQPIPDALLTIMGEDFSQGANSDAQGQFQVSIPKADPNTSSLNVVVIRKGYPERNFSIDNYTSGRALNLELEPEGGTAAEYQWQVDIFRYPVGENPPERDLVLADIMKVDEWLKDREALQQQGRLAEMLARRAMLQYAIGVQLEDVPPIAEEALSQFRAEGVTNSPFLPVLRAMQILVDLDSQNKEISEQSRSLNAATQGKTDMVRQLSEAIPRALSLADAQKSAISDLDAYKASGGTDYQKANAYLASAQLVGVKVLLELANTITGIDFKSKDRVISRGLDSLRDWVSDYEQLQQQIETELARY